jgi:hypothetical protein
VCVWGEGEGHIDMPRRSSIDEECRTCLNVVVRISLTLLFSAPA